MNSKSNNACASTFYGRGFSDKCVCGLGSSIYTSKTKDNPGRPFFRCSTQKDDHLFKWVEEAVYEEVVDALPIIGEVDSEMGLAKYKNEEMKDVVQELKKEFLGANWRSRSLKR